MAPNSNGFTSDPRFIAGRAGEMEVARWYKGRGWYVVPSYDYSGTDGDKAPRLSGLSRGYVVPDLDVSKEGRRVWIEVKTKSAPTRGQHGIPKRHFQDYLAVQKITGCRVWLVIREANDVWLMASLDSLARQVRFYNGDKMSKGGMAFFMRTAFAVLPVTRSVPPPPRKAP